MKMKKMLSIILCFCIVFCNSTSIYAKNRQLPKQQRVVADKIAEICVDNYEKYGVLPSVCVAQAFIESTLGTHCSGNNLWGICSGKEIYSTLEYGVKRYLKVINNGYYKDAPFEKDYKKQIRKILDGGYCEPEGNYYANAIWSIETYGFDVYDKKLLQKVKNKTKDETNNLNAEPNISPDLYNVSYAEGLSPNVLYVDQNIISGGCAMVYNEKEEYLGIYDIQPKNDKAIHDYNIISGDDKISGVVYLKLFENAKG